MEHESATFENLDNATITKTFLGNAKYVSDNADISSRSLELCSSSLPKCKRPMPASLDAYSLTTIERQIMYM